MVEDGFVTTNPLRAAGAERRGSLAANRAPGANPEEEFVAEYIEKASRDVTSWAFGSDEVAVSRARKQMFKDGKVSICGSSIREISGMGAGMALHLELQRSGAVLMLLMTAIAFPAMLVCYSGSRVPQSERDGLYMAQVSLANVGVDAGALIGNETSADVDVALLGTMTPEEQAMTLSWVDLGYSVLFLIYIWWFADRIKTVLAETDEGNVTPSDYAVLVKGLPPDATEREIVEHFDRLYNLWEPDWTSEGVFGGCCGRKDPRPNFMPENEVNINRTKQMARDRGIQGVLRMTADPVLDSRNQPESKREFYAGKWVAEVSVAHPNGDVIRRFQQLKELSKQLDLAVERALFLSYEKETAKHAEALKKVDQLARRVFRKNAKATTNKLSADCVGAFVLFENEESRRRCLYDATGFMNHPCGTPKPILFRGEHKLVITAASEPSDIMWENFEVEEKERRARTLAIGFLVLLLLLLSTAIVIFFQRERRRGEEGVPDVSICETNLPIMLYGEESLVPSGWSLTRDKNLEWDAAVSRAVEDGLPRPTMDANAEDVALGRIGGIEGETADILYSLPGNSSAPQCLRNSFHIRLDPWPIHRAWRTPVDEEKIPYYSYPFFLDSFLVNATTLEEQQIAYFDAFGVPAALRDAAIEAEIGHNQTVSCLSPCVDVKDSSRCPSLSSRTFTRNTVVGCYCLATFSNMVDSDGLEAAIKHIQDNDADLCLPFIEAYSISQSLAIGAAVLVVVINLALQVILTMLTKFEKHNSVSDEQSALARKIFVAQLVNTAFIVLIVNANIRHNTPELNDFFVGRFDSFTPKWYTAVGIGITITMLTNVVIPHLSPLSFALVINPILRYFAPKMSQTQLDAYYAPPEFLIASRYPVLLNNIFVTLLYSSGLPLLLPIASLSFFVSYWVDKFLVLRIYARPRGTDASLARLALSVMPFALVLHLAFGIYMYGDPETLQSQPLDVGTESPSSDPADMTARLFRANTAPLTVFLALLVGLSIVALTAGRAILFALSRLCLVITCGRYGGVELIEEEEELNPPYTGRFFQRISAKEAESIRDDPRVVLVANPYEDSNDSFLKLKLWGTPGVSGDRAHDADEPMATWEAIKDDFVHSYRMKWNPAYEEAVKVMDKALQVLGIDFDAHDLSLP